MKQLYEYIYIYIVCSYMNFKISSESQKIICDTYFHYFLFIVWLFENLRFIYDILWYDMRHTCGVNNVPDMANFCLMYFKQSIYNYTYPGTLYEVSSWYIVRTSSSCRCTDVWYNNILMCFYTVAWFLRRWGYDRNHMACAMILKHSRTVAISVLW